MKFMLRLLIPVWFLVLACAPKGFVFDGKKLPEVTVSDLGELYSTYKFTAQDQQQIKNQLKDQSLLPEIITFSHEEKWPAGLNTLEKRLAARSTIQKYHFYKVATIGAKTVLLVPADKNRHMPSNFIPSGPMYMVFSSKVVLMK
jgi:hypothetical protein